MDAVCWTGNRYHKGLMANHAILTHSIPSSCDVGGVSGEVR